MRTAFVLLLLLLSPLSMESARAEFAYRYVAEQSTYVINVEETSTLAVNVYLLEESDSNASQIADDGGMFALGVRLFRSSGAAVFLPQVEPNPSFDNFADADVTPTLASLYEEFNSVVGPGALPDDNSRVYIGSFQIDVGLLPGLTSTFDLLDYQEGGDQLVTFASRGLDSVTSSGSFFVTTVPEPSAPGLLGLFCLGLGMGGVGYRCRPVKRLFA